MTVSSARRAIARLLLAAVAVGLLAAPARDARAQAATPGAFTPGPCPIPPPAGYALDCGTLTVAESRQRPDSRTIDLAVAIVRSPSAEKRPDPVLFLAGGPGQPALPLVFAAPQVFSEILAERDMIFIDQRGTGLSQPALNCVPQAVTPARFLVPFGAADADRPAILQAGVESLLACGERYRAAGIDLTAYNSIESAADMEDLRVALGYPQWNLYGGSYGSRLALTMLEYRPATIRAAAIDSVYPPQANFHTDVFGSYRAAFERLSAACAADASCGAAYPDLPGAFDRVVERLNAEQAVLPIVNLETGEPIDYLPFSGVDVTLIVFQLMYVTPALPVLPALISKADRGDYRLLANLASALFVSPTPADVPPVSQGMQLAVQCNEDLTFASEDDFVRARDRNRLVSALAISPLFNEAALEVCDAWGLESAGGTDRAVRSDVPTLLLSGEFDPITPPRYAILAAETLSRSTQIVIPRGGHTAGLTSACGRATIAGFFDAPEQAPQPTCLAQEAQPFLVVP